MSSGGWLLVLLTAVLQSGTNLLLRKGLLFAGDFPSQLSDL